MHQVPMVIEIYGIERVNHRTAVAVCGQCGIFWVCDNSAVCFYQFDSGIWMMFTNELRGNMLISIGHWVEVEV